MPSTLLHLTFAQLVFPAFSVNHIDFLAGNLIPDETIDKKASHYRIRLPNSRIQVPDLETIAKDLLIKDDALKLGMYCHLYLDHYFIKDFLIPEFIWDFDTMQVINPHTGKVWNYNEFISKNGFYSAYTGINHRLIPDGYIDMNTVNQIPYILPQTGIPVFDTRRKSTWREELDKYLAQKVEYQDEFYEYDKLMLFIKKTANQFVEEVSN